MSEQPLVMPSLQELPPVGPSSMAEDYFLDQSRGHAYSSDNKRNIFQQTNDILNNTYGQVKSLADNNAVVFGYDSEGKGDYFLDGKSVTKNWLGLNNNFTAADIFKARRSKEFNTTLNKEGQRTKITGVTQDGNVLTEDVGAESLLRRAQAAGLVKPGSKYYSDRYKTISPAANLQDLTKSISQIEKKKDLVTVAGDQGIPLSELKTPEGQYKSDGKIRKQIANSVRLENQKNKDEGVIADAATQDVITRKRDQAATRKTLKEQGYTDAQIDALYKNKSGGQQSGLPASPGLSPQATNGLNPQSGAQRVQQRGAATGNPQVDALIDKHFSVNGGTPEALAKSLTSRNKIIEGVGEAMISNAVAFGSPQSVDARNWRGYAENTRKFERNQDHLRTLEANEAAYQFQREQQQMDHEMKQFEIRETNKMLREQWEKELEIEEQRRSDADFDNLTRMIMGLAGNL